MIIRALSFALFLSVVLTSHAGGQSALEKEVLAKYLNVEMPVALESCRLARPAFTTNSLATDEEVEDFLRADAEILKLKEPVPAATIFDFTLQREVNRELGIK